MGDRTGAIAWNPVDHRTFKRLRCPRHPRARVTVFAFDADTPLCWCCPNCAARDGWPWLQSELTPRARRRAASGKEGSLGNAT